MKRAIVIGGGVAGLTAAHELADRGFEVDVHEARGVVGGKARTVPVPGTGKDGRRDLPGEHGFRFFPGFYRHLDETLSRIPFGANRRGVLDNLVDTTRMGVAQPGLPLFENVARFPRSLDDLHTLQRALLESSFDVRGHELLRMAEMLWCIAASSGARRESELDHLPVTLVARAGGASTGYQTLVGLTQAFVALRADQISARTSAGIALQMYLDLFDPRRAGARVLVGPTSDAWLEPWRDHLLRKGVRFHFGSRARRLVVEGDRLASVELEDREVHADWYVLAVPVEAAARLVDAPLIAADPRFGNLEALSKHTRWMAGIQFFLRSKPAAIHGHVIHMRSPWALTSVFHDQFWRKELLETHGDGTLGALLSVDISDWETRGHNGRAARDCTPEEIKDEVWAQLDEGFRADGVSLDPDQVVAWQLDPSFHPAAPGRAASHDEPLFANVVGAWSLRPSPGTAVQNLVLAGDYVRTETDLASMEGANESARRAVNCILERAHLDAPRCALFLRREPALLAPLRWLDAHAHRAGLRWPFGRWPTALPAV